MTNRYGLQSKIIYRNKTKIPNRDRMALRSQLLLILVLLIISLSDGCEADDREHSQAFDESFRIVPVVSSGEAEVEEEAYLDDGIRTTIITTGYSGYTSGYQGSSPVTSWQINSAELGLWVAEKSSYGFGYSLTTTTKVKYSKVALGEIVDLVTYSPRGGLVKIYDLLESDSNLSASVFSLVIPAGESSGTYAANDIGRHILVLSAGAEVSNAVMIDVVDDMSVVAGRRQWNI